jgi:hypothetical protein
VGTLAIWAFYAMFAVAGLILAINSRSRFDTPEERVRRNLELHLDLMDAMNVVVTTNSELRHGGRPYANQRITDTGVAVYFTTTRAEHPGERPVEARQHLHAKGGGC